MKTIYMLDKQSDLVSIYLLDGLTKKQKNKHQNPQPQ